MSEGGEVRKIRHNVELKQSYGTTTRKTSDENGDSGDELLISQEFREVCDQRTGPLLSCGLLEVDLGVLATRQASGG